MEIVGYKSNKLKKQLSNASEIKKAYGVNAKRVSARLDEIKASPNLAVLMQLPTANCHPMTENRKGEWALDISANHRMIFEIAHDPVPYTDAGCINAIMVTDIRIIGTTDPH